MAPSQRGVLLILLLIYVVAAMLYILVPGVAMGMGQAVEEIAADSPLSLWQIAGANAALIFVLYGALGLMGLYLARKAGLPGVYREGAGWRTWVGRPLIIGILAGLALVILDLLAQRIGDFPGFPHPAFPGSLLASLSAGIGEEILCRLFLMSLWIVIWRWILGRVLFTKRSHGAALWIANVLAALTFAALHLPAAMLIFGAASPLLLPPMALAEIVILNGLVGLLVGWMMAHVPAVARANLYRRNDGCSL